MAADGFEKLVVYQRAGALADDVRGSVRLWGRLDIWTAGVQLVRAMDSVPANIAEATGRKTLRDQARFYVIARGSLREVQHWLIRAEARDLPLPEDVHIGVDEISRMLSGLIRSTART